MSDLLDTIHEILGPLATDDLQRLENSVEKDGLIMPVVTQQSTGKIIDGRHRANISEDYAIIELDVDERGAVRQALALNLARRHLSKEQKRELVSLLRKAGFTQQEVGEMMGQDRSTVSKAEGSIVKNHDASLDLRYKIGKKEKEVILGRLKGDETQRQIAADFGISRRRVGQLHQKAKQREEKERERAAEPKVEDDNILTGDMRILGDDVPDDSVDLIFTDPPYGKEHIPDYEALAEFAVRVLKPGGSLLCYVGQSVLPDIIAVILPYLRYWWILGIEHTGPTQRFPGKWIFIEWKPILWFVKGSRRGREFLGDFVKSKPDKIHHPWGQGIEEALYYIEHLTIPGELVCDPFLGGATTCVAAKRLHRRYLAFEIDPKVAEDGKRRVANEMP